MQNSEMTMSEVLRDPVIRQMLRADRVSLSEFAKLLEKTARARNEVSRERGAIALIEGSSAGSEMGY
ncbi:hypothetical protein [Rhizobium sp. SG570]|uniref:hypothetical protein n=1 Tax=Rhizobium sp. SG570 TaxID=2587113 RepID=UPI001444A25C|nr:hypothetical protein [Rhizobium sp. SG570]